MQVYIVMRNSIYDREAGILQKVFQKSADAQKFIKEFQFRKTQYFIVTETVVNAKATFGDVNSE